MHTLWRRLFLIVSLLVVAAPALAQDAASQGMFRFVHAVTGAAAVDIYTDGQLTVSDLSFGQASEYIRVGPGAHAVVVTQHGQTNTVWEQQVNVGPDSAVTLVASSTDPLEFQVFQDDLSSLTLGTARLTAIHAIEGLGGLDVLLTDGRAVMPGLQYNQPYGTLDVPTGTYEITVVPEGADLESALLPSATLNLGSSTSYIVVLYGSAEAPSILTLSESTLADGSAGFVRFANAAATDVDVLADEVLVAPALSSTGTATEYMAFAPGSVEVVARGTSDNEAVAADTVEVSAGAYLTVIVVQTADGAQVQVVDDPVSTIGESESVVSVINTLTDDGEVAITSGSATVLGGVAAGEIDSAILQPSAEALSAAITTSGETYTFDLTNVVYGGVYYSVLVTSGDTDPVAILLNPVSLAQTISSTPGGQALPTSPTEPTAPTTSAPEETAAPAEEPAAEATPEAVATSTPEVSVPQATSTPAPAALGPVARVLVDPGANLHIRQYPTSSAFSLALAPSGALLNVTGRQGAPELGPEETPEPEATQYVDPASLLASTNADLNPADTWLYVTYTPTTGGEVVGWVNALFVTVSDAAGRPQRLANLPTIPSNRAGETHDTSSAQPRATSTPIAADSVIATVLLNEGANLHLRRNPDASAESLALIPSGAQVVVNARTESGEWLHVTYEGREGWIASLYVTLSRNGTPYQSALIPVLSTPTPTPTLEATPAA